MNFRVERDDVNSMMMLPRVLTRDKIKLYSWEGWGWGLTGDERNVIECSSFFVTHRANRDHVSREKRKGCVVGIIFSGGCTGGGEAEEEGREKNCE